jgi:hypothetical protein
MVRWGKERYGVEESVDGENGEEGGEEFGEVAAAHRARKREKGRGRRGDGAGANFSELATALGHDEIGSATVQGMAKDFLKGLGRELAMGGDLHFLLSSPTDLDLDSDSDQPLMAYKIAPDEETSVKRAHILILCFTLDIYFDNNKQK